MIHIRYKRLSRRLTLGEENSRMIKMPKSFFSCESNNLTKNKNVYIFMIAGKEHKKLIGQFFNIKIKSAFWLKGFNIALFRQPINQSMSSIKLFLHDLFPHCVIAPAARSAAVKTGDCSTAHCATKRIILFWLVIFHIV